MSDSNCYDVVIIGGGIVGLTLANALSRTHLKIAIVEARSFEAPKRDQLDHRVSAITRSSQQIFSNLGVWTTIQQARVSPYREMIVWDAKNQGEIHFNCNEIGEENLGYIIENQVMQQALIERLQQTSLEWRCPAKLQAIQNTHTGVTIILEDGQRLDTRLVVGADGAQSKVRQLAAMDSIGWDYGQKALICTVKTEIPHQQIAWQRFMPSGPLAFLPLAEPHLSSIVWSTTPEHAEHLLHQEDDQFKKSLAIAFDHRLGAIKEMGPRFSFSLHMQHTQQYVQSRIALLGDSAHVIHPLAGQGLNLGLLDAACLAEVILNALEKKRDIGSLHTLRRYERWRKGHNWMMTLTVDGLKRLFGTEFIPVTWMRGMGLNLTDRLPLLKNEFMRYAMGI